VFQISESNSSCRNWVFEISQGPDNDASTRGAFTSFWTRRRQIVAVVLIVIVVVGLVGIAFYNILMPKPIVPPDEWTLVAVAREDAGVVGWEQAARVYHGVREDVFFIRVVWNETRNHLRGIFWNDDYEDLFSGDEGVVSVNGSFVENRYIYVTMSSESDEHEIVIGQFPQTPAEIVFQYNVRWVYKSGDDYSAIVGILPFSGQTLQPIDVNELHILSVESGYRIRSRLGIYLSGNIPPASDLPIIDGYPDDWESLTKLIVNASNISGYPQAIEAFSLSNYNNNLSILFSINYNYTAMFQRFANASIQTLSQLLLYRGGVNDTSYSVYLAADSSDDIISTTGDYLHVWTIEGQTFFQRLALPESVFAVNETYEASLPSQIWETLMETQQSPLHISPRVDVAYVWEMVLV
jgi:hypothetical protein